MQSERIYHNDEISNLTQPVKYLSRWYVHWSDCPVESRRLCISKLSINFPYSLFQMNWIRSHLQWWFPVELDSVFNLTAITSILLRRESKYKRCLFAWADFEHIRTRVDIQSWKRLIWVSRTEIYITFSTLIHFIWYYIGAIVSFSSFSFFLLYCKYTISWYFVLFVSRVKCDMEHNQGSFLWEDISEHETIRYVHKAEDGSVQLALTSWFGLPSSFNFSVWSANLHLTECTGVR